MKNKKLKLLSIFLSVCVLGTSSASAAEFSSGSFSPEGELTTENAEEEITQGEKSAKILRLKNLIHQKNFPKGNLQKKSFLTKRQIRQRRMRFRKQKITARVLWRRMRRSIKEVL